MDYKRINEFRLLGLTIAYYRKLRGLTQAELAEATNLSRTHISNIEAPNGKTSILQDCACLFGKRNTDITSNIAKTQH